jgi:chemotaxis methyl-accepting protein methylase
MMLLQEKAKDRIRLYVATCSKCSETYHVAIYPASMSGAK